MKRYYQDKELIEGIAKKEREAINELYRSRVSGIKNYVENNSGSIEDGIEITQRAIIILYEKVQGGEFELQEGTKLSTYLFSIGKNLWLKELRKFSKTDSLSSRDDFIYEEAENDDYRQEIDKMIACLEKLDPICRKLIRAKYFHKISDKVLVQNKEINLELENVRRRRYKCMNKLRNMFNKCK